MRDAQEALSYAEAESIPHALNACRNSSIVRQECKRQAMLRKAAERTVDALWNRIGKLVEAFTPKEYANYFAAAGYDAD